ncbi:MAG: hypothetical protein RL563_201 [Pseudomonadota bacterium]
MLLTSFSLYPPDFIFSFGNYSARNVNRWLSGAETSNMASAPLSERPTESKADLLR